MSSTITAFRAATRYREVTRGEAMGRVARKGFEMRIVKKSMSFEVEGREPVNLVLNDIVYVDSFDTIAAFQKIGHFYIVSED